MRGVLLLVAAPLFLADAASAHLGPGAGPWETATPESQGLSTQLLDQVEQRVEEAMTDRLCYLVVKNGYIVHETYRRGHTESSLHAGWSTTKSLCASLYGVAVQQGWANVDDLVRERNSGTRECNADASFSHVLAMTGQSANIDNPVFNYDASGLACLDTLADFIEENNPEGLTGREWKDKYYQEALGFEHSVWEDGPGVPGPGHFPCGWGIQASCRDLARAGQVRIPNMYDCSTAPSFAALMGMGMGCNGSSGSMTGSCRQGCALRACSLPHASTWSRPGALCTQRAG